MAGINYIRSSRARARSVPSGSGSTRQKSGKSIRRDRKSVRNSRSRVRGKGHHAPIPAPPPRPRQAPSPGPSKKPPNPVEQPPSPRRTGYQIPDEIKEILDKAYFELVAGMEVVRCAVACAENNLSVNGQEVDVGCVAEVALKILEPVVSGLEPTAIENLIDERRAEGGAGSDTHDRETPDDSS